MIRISKLVASCVAVLTVGVFSSCNKDSSHENYNISYGEIFGTEENSYIITDKNNRLNVIENFASWFPVSDGKRVIVNYSILGEKENGYDVRMNAIDSILTKKPVYPSRLSPSELEELGNDPIYLLDVWFGGTKYLNITFEVLRNNPSIAHFINLAVDESKSSADEVVVELKHNAFEDATLYRAFGNVSFDISEFIPEGKDEIKITLNWTNYDGQKRSDSGVFKRNTENKLQVDSRSGNDKTPVLFK